MSRTVQRIAELKKILDTGRRPPTPPEPAVDDPTVDDPTVDDRTVDDPTVDDPTVDDLSRRIAELKKFLDTPPSDRPALKRPPPFDKPVLDELMALIPQVTYDQLLEAQKEKSGYYREENPMAFVVCCKDDNGCFLDYFRPEGDEESGCFEDYAFFKVGPAEVRDEGFSQIKKDRFYLLCGPEEDVWTDISCAIAKSINEWGQEGLYIWKTTTTKNVTYITMGGHAYA